jgi:hypothetical protein
MDKVSHQRSLVLITDEDVPRHIKGLSDYLGSLSHIIQVKEPEGSTRVSRDIDGAMVTLDLKLNSSEGPEPTHDAQPPRVINLSRRGVTMQKIEHIDFIVQEGPFSYRLPHRYAGWGSVISNLRRASVRMVRVASNSNVASLLGEAEIRTNPARPDFNSLQVAGAAMALIRQGCLERDGAPFELGVKFHAPSPNIRDDGKRFLRRVLRSVDGRLRPRRQQWNIGFVAKATVQFGRPFPWHTVRWLDPLRDGFIADPFLTSCDGISWLFYERLLYGENQGTLWVAKLDTQSGRLTDASEILRLPVHLSYPNVFKYDTRWYMLPEQARSGATVLYHSVEFPYRWEQFHVLLPEFPGIDPVLFRHGGRWWLFVTHGASPCTDNNLFLFSAEELKGIWIPHPMNPIKTGLKGSRMAGPISQEAETMIRPGQDCREGYGMGLVLHKILQLDQEVYREEEISSWAPQSGGPYSEGFHHFMICDDVLMIDGQRNQRVG